MQALSSRSLPSCEALHSLFLALLPRLQTHGRVYFRHLKSEAEKQEAIAEMVALAWGWFVRLYQRGKDPRSFPTALVTFAARAVGSGRKLCGQDRAKDVLSRRAQRLHGFAVSSLPRHSPLHGHVFEDALLDNTQSEVVDQVVFRCDFPRWRQTRTERDRRLMDDLMIGERTKAVARKYGLSQARVSQLRRDFQDDWERFGDAHEVGPAPVGCRK